MATDDGWILVRRAGSSGAWTEPEMTTYRNEDHLQTVLATGPGRVPGVDNDALTAREVGTSAGPIDVCIVAGDGAITVVECKLASNSERRRMVIGQVIDYASAIWRDGDEALLAAWRRAGGVDLVEALTPGALEQLRRNITDARINLCLAVDRIDEDLQRLVEYLNRVTLDEVAVTAIQLTYARHGGVEILIPSSFGGEIAAAKVRSSERGVAWTRDSFLAALSMDGDRVLANRLYELLDAAGERQGSHPLVWYGTSPGGGVFLHPLGLRYAPVQLWVNKSRQLMLYGNWGQYPSLENSLGFEELARFLGQDHEAGRRGVPVSSLDVEALWSVIGRCAMAINEGRQEGMTAS